MKLKHFFVIAIIIVLPLVFSMTSPRFAENLRLFSYSLIKPILQITQTVGHSTGEIYYRFRDYSQVYYENKRLKTELVEMRKQLVDQKEILTENERLKKLLGFKQAVEFKAVPARIIARDISYWSRWIVLDKGKEDGVLPGMTLVSDQGLVGRVVSAGRHIARGILIIDGESRVSAIVQTTRDTALLEGRGDDPLLLKLIPLESRVKKGDAIITSGLGGNYPKGIPVGSIETVSTDRDGLHQTAVLKPFADFSKLEEILCLSTTAPN
jgi:rod shape-determining protein MreC